MGDPLAPEPEETRKVFEKQNKQDWSSDCGLCGRTHLSPTLTAKQRAPTTSLNVDTTTPNLTNSSISVHSTDRVKAQGEHSQEGTFPAPIEKATDDETAGVPDETDKNRTKTLNAERHCLYWKTKGQRRPRNCVITLPPL